MGNGIHLTGGGWLGLYCRWSLPTASLYVPFYHRYLRILVDHSTRGYLGTQS